jgi:hypothetical protein
LLLFFLFLEYLVITPKGKKQLRFLDIAGVTNPESEDENEELVRLIQVGKTDEKGRPVKREQEAIDDIEKATKKKVEFYDYEANLKKGK